MQDTGIRASNNRMQALGSLMFITISVELRLTKSCLEPMLPFVVLATRVAFQVPSCIGIRSSGDCRLFGPLQKKCIPSLDWLKSVQIGLTCDLFHPSFLASIGSYGPVLCWTFLWGQLAQWCSTSLPSSGISRDWSKTLESTRSQRERESKRNLDWECSGTFLDSLRNMFTYVYICLHMFTYVYICLHMFTYVYICL